MLSGESLFCSSYEDGHDGRMGCDAVQTSKSILTFRMNIALPHSRLNMEAVRSSETLLPTFLVEGGSSIFLLNVGSDLRIIRGYNPKDIDKTFC